MMLTFVYQRVNRKMSDHVNAYFIISLELPVWESIFISAAVMVDAEL